MKRILFSLPMLLLVLGLAVNAETVSVPYEFSNGSAADADQVNANFDTLEGVLAVCAANAASAQSTANAAAAGHTVDTNTTYTAGAGLILTGETFSADTAVVQARVYSSCSVGASISAITADGTVTCEAITGAPSVTIVDGFGNGTLGTLPDTRYDESTLELAFTASTGEGISGSFF